MSERGNAPVLARRDGRIGRLTLNRADALNALTLDMTRIIAAALDAWRNDPAIHAIVLDASGRAFCAGGDVRALRAQAMAEDYGGIERFFTEEYALNLMIAQYPKPYVSLIDGLCMGGGLGISMHGGLRVVTDQAAFAMPETGIGLFPDVGASFFLPRLRGCYGMYLALTGARIGAADAAWLGLATHVVPREAMAGLADAMAKNGLAPLAMAAKAVAAGPIAEVDDRVFAGDSLATVMAALAASRAQWARETLAGLRLVSPSALLWTFEIVRRGAERTLPQCQAAELALTRRVVRRPDFVEGVRAMLVDKDRAPLWSPARIEDVDAAEIANWFEQ